MTNVPHMQAKSFTVRKQENDSFGKFNDTTKLGEFSFATDTNPGISGAQSTQKYHSGGRQLVNPWTSSAGAWAPPC